MNAKKTASSGRAPIDLALAHRRHTDASILRVDALASPTVGEMFRLYESYYEATDLRSFEKDLGDKDFVIILLDSTERIVGFSTLAITEAQINRASLRAMYSGDTIIARRHWGTQILAFSWIRFAGSIKAQFPATPLYWFLIVKGHRTYRYLPTFAIDFYPHWLKPTPRATQDIMDTLASRRFGEYYDQSRGVVSFPVSRGHLKEVWTAIDPDEALRPDVSFFLRANPGYARGDELVCLTELSSANLRPIARRIFDKGSSMK